jgi:hypothetical protein
MKLRDEVGDVDDATDVDDAEDRLCVWNPSRADIVTPTLSSESPMSQVGGPTLETLSTSTHIGRK